MTKDFVHSFMVVPVPPELEPDAMRAAKETKGLSYLDMSIALKINSRTIERWMSGESQPAYRNRRALLALLYDREFYNEVWVRFSGHEVKAEIEEMLGKTARLKWRQRTGRWKRMQVNASKRPVFLGNAWAEEVCQEKGLGTMAEVLERLRKGERIKLDSHDFVTQALANTLDRTIGYKIVDRGEVGSPENLFTRPLARKLALMFDS